MCLDTSNFMALDYWSPLPSFSLLIRGTSSVRGIATLQCFIALALLLIIVWVQRNATSWGLSALESISSETSVNTMLEQMTGFPAPVSRVSSAGFTGSRKSCGVESIFFLRICKTVKKVSFGYKQTGCKN